MRTACSVRAEPRVVQCWWLKQNAAAHQTPSKCLSDDRKDRLNVSEGSSEHRTDRHLGLIGNKRSAPLGLVSSGDFNELPFEFRKSALLWHAERQSRKASQAIQDHKAQGTMESAGARELFGSDRQVCCLLTSVGPLRCPPVGQVQPITLNVTGSGAIGSRS